MSIWYSYLILVFGTCTEYHMWYLYLILDINFIESNCTRYLFGQNLSIVPLTCDTNELVHCQLLDSK